MAKRKKKKDSGGAGGFLLLVILALAVGVGGWNYQRNLAIETEKANSRPFQGYSDDALADLASAYGEEAEFLDRKYKASLERRTGVRDAQGLISEKIEEFERVQKIGDSIRVATSKVADSEARLRQIRDEQAWRRNDEQWQLHLRRLTTI